MTFIALDDEPPALLVIEKLARDLPDWQLAGAFTDAATAVNFLQNNPVDLLLSDINMPDMSGLQLVHLLPENKPMVIFLTAHKEHAHIGFELDVLDYLIKPVSPERFQKALKKAADLIELRKKTMPVIMSHTEASFFVFSDYLQVKIIINEILYIEGMGDYVKIYLNKQTRPVITLERLKNLAERLTEYGFLRIHRSYLININKVTAKQKARIKIGEKWLPIGDTYQYNLLFK